MSYVPPHLRKAAVSKAEAEDKWNAVKPKKSKEPKKEEFPELKSSVKTLVEPVKPAEPEKSVTFQPATSVPPKMDFSKLFKNAGPKPMKKPPMKRGLVLLSKTRPKDSMTEEEWNLEEEERLLMRQDLHFQKITLDLEKRRNQMREYDPSYESEQVITSSSEEDLEEVVEEEEEEDVVEDELEDE
jgi:hypothetical protein